MIWEDEMALSLLADGPKNLKQVDEAVKAAVQLIVEEFDARDMLESNDGTISLTRQGMIAKGQKSIGPGDSEKSSVAVVPEGFADERHEAACMGVSMVVLDWVSIHGSSSVESLTQEVIHAVHESLIRLVGNQRVVIASELECVMKAVDMPRWNEVFNG
ncbi:MAG: hypothetical protein IPK83_18530 [Planctomycetes bacterium]|nr:hypothetical protein [Planctomycetota bacterium]